MAIVVRLGPLPLRHRREARIAELERIFATDIELTEVVNVPELIAAVTTPGVIAVALDATPPGELEQAIRAAGSVTVLRPLWAQRRSDRGEVEEVFAGYGVLTDAGVSELADGERLPPGLTP